MAVHCALITESLKLFIKPLIAIKCLAFQSQVTIGIQINISIITLSTDFMLYDCSNRIINCLRQKQLDGIKTFMNQ